MTKLFLLLRSSKSSLNYPNSTAMDWKKFLASFFEAVPWMKNIRFILGTALIAVLVYMAWFTFFRKVPQNVSNQKVVVTPFAKVDKIDQSSIQVMVEEKTWSADVLVGAVNYDNKSGAFVGFKIGKKW